MKEIIRFTTGTLKNNFRSIFLFELIYRIIFLSVYVRLSNRIIKIILNNCGYSYLNIKNIGEVLKNPLTYPLVFLIILISILFAGYEMSVLYTGFRSAASGNNMKIIVMIARGFARYVRMFVPRNIVFLIINGIVLYTFNAFWIYKLVFFSKRVAEILSNLREYKAAVFLILLICIILIFIAIRYLFCTCYYMCSPVNHRDAIKKGKGFYKGRILRIILMYVAVTVLYLAVYVIVHSVLMVVVATLVVIFAPHSYEMALIDVIGRYINMIIMYFGSLFSPILYYGLTVSMFSFYENGIKNSEQYINASYKVQSWKKRTVIIVSFAVIIGTIINVAEVVKNGNLTMSDAFGKISITSHRGDSKEAPENTIPAVNKAIENLSDYAEIDVRQTKDGEIILMHDASLYRTTGVRRNVSDTTYEEIKCLDAGAHCAREYAGTGIPTLEEVLKICKGKMKLNIEIKAGREYGDFIQKIVDIVKEYDMEEQCVFTSTTYSYLKRLKGINIDLITGYIVAAGYGDYFQDDNVDFYSVSSAYLSKALIDKAHGYGKEIHAWTVNDRSELVRMKRIGVDNVITDVPVYAREVLYGEERTQSLVSYIKMLLE